jgi:acylphosphatase
VSFALESDALGADDGPLVRVVDRGCQVRGRVQGGVSVVDMPGRSGLGLVGSVKNFSDGSVQVRVRGTPETLDQLESLLQLAPRWLASIRSTRWRRSWTPG